MGKRIHGGDVSSFLLAFLWLQLGLTTAQTSSAWRTLSGNSPAIIAKGGFSGLFPDSSSYAYSSVSGTSANGTTLWCDVRLTKDSVGICLPDIKLDNCTTIQYYFGMGKKTYVVNGVKTSGWFSVDYSISDLAPVTLTQAIYSRTYRFDSAGLPILSVDDVVTQVQPSSLWLNIQHDAFYTQHNLSMSNYVLSLTKRVTVNYLSSPELAFLRRIAPSFTNTKTKLIFRFLDKGIKEPSTNRTYRLLLNNLKLIRTFASGILVPKSYIWPVTPDNYLLPYTSIVTDAHKAGLEIYAADFANDNLFSYNYSYDPLTECLSFIDNGLFSVDGVVTDFPITPSEAIGCFSRLNKSRVDGKPLIISNNGASGDYPDCTDLAYNKAVEDGADVIDCPVQVTQDKILICMSSVDLIEDTTVTKSPYKSRLSDIPKLKSTAGIFTFNLTWNEIQKLKPIISQPMSEYGLKRNPRNINSGNFTKLSDFLALANNKSLSGILIGIENAVFMAEQLRIDVVDAVISALNDAGKNKTASEVMIQSTDSSVLVKFKQLTKYKLVYKIDEVVGDAIASSVKDIEAFADAVALPKESIYAVNNLFTTEITDLVPKLHAAGLDVYVYVLRNEFVSQPWDFLSDGTVEINAYVVKAGVDGIITDFPGTASRYKRNSCSKLGSKKPNYMLPIKAGQLLPLMAPDALPPALAPMPVLNASDVVEPPFPQVTPKGSVGAEAPPPTAPPKAPSPSSGQQQIASLLLALPMVMLSVIHLLV
ncbi:glycerophosphodiester phosphodiesterase GDPDL4-like [Musa acuminata AAA Group]|uniref:glycerophosphodiester phosphodiesterase GDPDL4-like n=1 Tax=Musa acuminata AAA Group TaxID=214697 RepID=UPI0031D579AE